MIKLEDVTKVYKGEVLALRDASCDIQRGEFVFLVGQSGSGKSKEIGSLSKWRVPRMRRQIGSIFQDFKLLPNKTVSHNVAFALEVIGTPKQVIRDQVPAILELVGLQEKTHRLPHELSGGEQQRVSIARAFVNRPLILLADEPTGNLDPGTSVEIMRLLERINETGTTVVMATHDRGIVDTMRRRVIELNEGEIVRDQARGVYE
jgi:cell division transport system ATP-binding protein